MKKRIKSYFGRAVCSTALLFTLVTVMLTPRASAAPLRFPVTLDGNPTPLYAYLMEDGVTYLPLRALANTLLPEATVSWEPEQNGGGRARVRSDDTDLHVADGDAYITANERHFAVTALPENGVSSLAHVRMENGVTYVPLRAGALAMGAQSVEWRGEGDGVNIVSGPGSPAHADTYYKKEDLYWLAKIIYAEAGDQPLTGQIAVGNVILNRRRHRDFPNTVYGVIFDRKYGVQFTPTANGAIHKNPSALSVTAAKLVLEGTTVSREALYFLDPTLADSFWVPQNRPYLFTVGCHDFYG